ncbi:zinc finger MYM-type protein 1-like [Macrosteles quadrilineatus]|uniref:zinc finger MYM-type protein 1-like n=1 Tax=Macrosteles quadrilineatus TaxID=74068 RepID=UPI0023E2E160|nr:zinc finger MYM-type protein 1-like [Macrosteles quadrilineatus]
MSIPVKTVVEFKDRPDLELSISSVSSEVDKTSAEPEPGPSVQIDLKSTKNVSSTEENLKDKRRSNDIVHFVSNSQITFEERAATLEKVWTPRPAFKFPGSGKRNLRFQYKWLHRWTWLSYSKEEDGAFCKYCVLFAPHGAGKGYQPLGKFCKEKFSNWKDAVEVFDKPQNTDYHKKCLLQANQLALVSKNRQDPIDQQINSALKEQIEENRRRFRPIVETIILCGRQNIPLRGHRDHGAIDLAAGEPLDNDGNFRSLLRFRALAGDEGLRKHLGTCKNNAMYISPQTQNEIIGLCNDFILDQLVSKVNASKCFTVLADKTTDIAGIEQMSLGARYFDVRESRIREDFLQFVPVKDVSGKGIATSILNSLSDIGIDLQYM